MPGGYTHIYTKVKSFIINDSAECLDWTVLNKLVNKIVFICADVVFKLVASHSSPSQRISCQLIRSWTTASMDMTHRSCSVSQICWRKIADPLGGYIYQMMSPYHYGPWMTTMTSGTDSSMKRIKLQSSHPISQWGGYM